MITEREVYNELDNSLKKIKLLSTLNDSSFWSNIESNIKEILCQIKQHCHI